jgi:uncharacterized membrane protein
MTVFIKVIIWLCAVTSLLTSLYLSLDHLPQAAEQSSAQRESKKWCDYSSAVSCTDVLLSPWARLFFVPVALLGLVWSLAFVAFATSLLMSDQGVASSKAQDSAQQKASLQREGDYQEARVFLWLLSGMAFVVYLLVAEIILGKICPLCTVVHIVTCIAFVCIVALRSRRSAATRSTLASSVVRLLTGDKLFIAAALGFAVLLIAFVAKERATPSEPYNGQVRLMRASELDCLIANNVRFFGSSSCGVCSLQHTYFSYERDQKTRFYLDCKAALNSLACEQAVRAKRCFRSVLTRARAHIVETESSANVHPFRCYWHAGGARGRSAVGRVVAPFWRLLKRLEIQCFRFFLSRFVVKCLVGHCERFVAPLACLFLLRVRARMCQSSAQQTFTTRASPVLNDCMI